MKAFYLSPSKKILLSLLNSNTPSMIHRIPVLMMKNRKKPVSWPVSTAVIDMLPSPQPFIKTETKKVSYVRQTMTFV